MRTYTVLFIGLVVSSAMFAAEPAAGPAVENGKLPIPAKFIVSMISDNNGGVWVGTEDDGLFHYNKEVKQYTKQDGLGDDNAYALAQDKNGILWVGHLKTGVSCFNGKDWQNYDALHGPVGERIFDIQVSPADGDVWLATSAGISRYNNSTKEWTDYTRDDGLPEDQCSSLSFQKDSTLIIGTQSAGIAVFKRQQDGNYAAGQTFTAPERFGKDGISPVPLDASGEGLPNNLINKIIVTENDDVYIGTSAGLAETDKTLQKIKYLRGKDYAEKVQGLYGGAPKDWKECAPDLMKQLLPEDYVTALTPAADGKLWIGFRQQGLILYDPKTKEQKAFKVPSDFVTEIVADKSGSVFVGTYGGGVVKITSGEPKPDDDEPKMIANKEAAPLPKPRENSADRRLKTLFEDLKQREKNNKLPRTMVLTDDWTTRGDWIGTYGTYAGVLCGQAGGGMDFCTGNFNAQWGYFDEQEQLGYAHWTGKADFDATRYWVHWNSEDIPKSLRDRVLQMERGGNRGDRRQTEVNDSKQEYPMTIDGPHVYGTYTLPPGKYIMSLYFFNKDGHAGKNRYRDFFLTVKTAKVPKKVLEKNHEQGREAEEIFLKQKGGAHSRVPDSWGGVWKRFYVQVDEGESVMLKVDANFSFNTMLCAVMFDDSPEAAGKRPKNRNLPPDDSYFPPSPLPWYQNILRWFGG